MAKPRLLNREQASTYLLEVWGIKRTPLTLQNFVVTRGRGPDYQKLADRRVILQPHSTSGSDQLRSRRQSDRGRELHSSNTAGA